MATKKKAATPTIDTPPTEPEPIPKQVSAQDRLDQLTKDQKKSQDAYRDTGPAVPS